MKALGFRDEDEDPIEAETDNEKPETNTEFVEKLESIMAVVYQPDSPLMKLLTEWVNESLFLSMPYTARANFSGASGTLRRCLTIIDYMNAMNVGWDMQVDKKEIVTLALLKHIAISGYKTAPKMAPKQGKGIRITKLTWAKNIKYDENCEKIGYLWIHFIKAKVELPENVLTTIFDLAVGKEKSKLGCLLVISESYVDRFLK